MAIIGIVAANAEKPTLPISRAMSPAADAPAKYVIDVHKKFFRQEDQTLSPAFKAVLIATRIELPKYCTTAITQIAIR